MWNKEILGTDPVIHVMYSEFQKKSQFYWSAWQTKT